MKTALLRFRRFPEFWLLLTAVLVFLPLRQVLAEHVPFLAAVFAFLAFLLPGVGAVCLIGHDGSAWERLPLGFVASLAVFGLLAQAATVLHTSILVYAWAFALLGAGIAAAALLRAWRAGAEAPPQATAEGTSRWLQVALLVIVAGSVVFWFNSPTDGDHWDNLAWMQNIRHDPEMMLAEPRFEVAPVSPRFLFSTWLVHQALMSLVSGLDPVDLFGPLGLPLMLLSLAAVYGLARRVAGRKDPAAMILVVWGLYLMLWNQGTVAGYEVVVRSSLDKVIAGFILVPVGLSLALETLEAGGRGRWLGLLACGVAGGLMHPITGALWALSLAGFAVLEMAFNFSRATAARLAGVAALLSLALLPSLYLLVWGGLHPGTSIIATTLTDTRDPSLALELRGTLNRERIWILEGGAYIMHPRLILQTLHIPAFLGLPLLLWRSRRDRTARFLSGLLIFLPLAVAFPPAAGVLGSLVTPFLFYRLHWPLSMAAAMALGLGAHALIARMPPRLRGAPAGSLALLVVAGLSLPQVRSSFVWLAERKADPQADVCRHADPILRPFQTLAAQGAMVLAEEDMSFCLVAYAPYARVVSFRATNGVRTFIFVGRTDEGWQRLFDAQAALNREVVDERLLAILSRWGVNYLIVRLDSPLDSQLSHLPVYFQPVETAFQHRIYRVLATRPVSKLVQANSVLSAGDGPGAIQAFQSSMQAPDADSRYLAALGLGKAYLQAGQPEPALAAWSQALEASRQAEPFALQGEVHSILGDSGAALQAYEQAVQLQPDHAGYQTRLGDLYQQLGRTSEAETAYRLAAGLLSVPGSSAFYLHLGQMWSDGGGVDRALAAWERSLRILPTGAAHGLIGQARQSAGRWAEAEAEFRQMLALDRWDWKAHQHLSSLYADQGWAVEAISQARRALQLHPLASRGYQALGQLWASQEGVPAAIDRLEGLPGYRLGFGDARLAAAGLQARAGRLDRALQEAGQAVAWYLLDESAYRSVASYHLAIGRVQQAADGFRQALELDVDDTSAYLGLALVAAARGDMAADAAYNLRATVAAPHNAAPRLALAAFYESQARPDLAAVQYQEALSAPGAGADAWAAWGEFQLRQGEPDRAMESFKTALAHQPDSIAAYLGMGSALLSQGEVAQAGEALGQAVRRHPGEGAAHAALAQHLLRQGDSSAALEAFEKAITLDPGYRPAYTALARAHFGLGRIAEAESAYQDLLRAAPDYPEGYVGLGGLYERRGQPQRAAGAYRQALVRVSPALSASAQVALAELQRRQGLFDQALSGYRAALAGQPTYTGGYVALARFQAGRGDLAAAAETLRDGLALVPGSIELSQALAEDQARQGDVGGAIVTYRRALGASPGARGMVIGLANLLASIGRPDQALAQLRQARQRWAGDVLVLAALASVEISAGEPEAAVNTATALVETAPGQADSWLVLGEAQTAAGRLDGAEVATRGATLVEPGSAPAWLALGRFLLAGDDIGEAVAALNQAAGLDAADPGPPLALAATFERQGASQQALAEYLAAAELDASDGSALLASGLLRQRQNLLEEAQRDFAQALEAAPTDPRVHRALADLQLRQGQLAVPRRELIMATEAASGDCRAFRNLGDFLADRGEWRAAEIAYRRALELAGCASEAHVRLANLYLAHGEPGRAMAEAHQAILANPSDPWGHVLLAETQAKTAAWAEAAASLRKASAAWPGSGLLRIALSQILLLGGEPDEGLAVAREAVAVEPINALAWVALGRAQRFVGAFDEAEDSYQKAVEVDYRVIFPLLELGDLYQALARFDEAAATFRQAMARAPSDPRGTVAMANLLRARGQPQAAIQLYEEAAGLDRRQIQALLSLGEVYQQQGRTQEAGEAFQQALAQALVDTSPLRSADAFEGQVVAPPAAAQAYIELGDWQTRQWNWAGAEDSYRRAIAAARGDPGGYLGLGRAFLVQGRLDEAQVQFEAAAEVGPTSSNAWLALGDLHWRLADWSAAGQAYAGAVAALPSDAGGYLRLSDLYRLQDKSDGAETELQKALRLTPRAAGVYVALGDSHRSQAQAVAAEAAYRAATEIAGADPRGRIRLGDLYRAQGRLEEAQAQFEAAVEVAPGSADAWLALGDWLGWVGDLAAAESAYREAARLALAPGDIGPLLKLARVYQDRGRPADAWAQVQMALALGPGDASAQQALAEWHLRNIDLERADRALQEAVAGASDEVITLLQEGLSELAKGHTSRAYELFEASIAADPGSVLPYLAMGQWWRGVPALGAAEQAYRSAVELAPGDVGAYIRLGRLYQREGRGAEAMVQYQAAQAVGPANGPARLALGDGYREQGNFLEAEQAYRKAIELAPGDIDGYLHLADLYRVQGRLDEVQAQFEAAASAGVAAQVFLCSPGSLPARPEELLGGRREVSSGCARDGRLWTVLLAPTAAGRRTPVTRGWGISR